MLSTSCCARILEPRLTQLVEWDRTLPAELRIYLTIPWTAPHLILFVLMRYSTMVTVAMGMYSTWHRFRGNCVTYRDAAVLMVQLSVSAVLGWRTVAIWQKDARIFVIVALLLITLMVCFRRSLCWARTCSREQWRVHPDARRCRRALPSRVVLRRHGGVRHGSHRAQHVPAWQHHNDVGVFPVPMRTIAGDGVAGSAGCIRSGTASRRCCSD